MNSRLRILFLGDLVGDTGRAIFAKHIARLKSELKIDGIVVNGENSSTQGKGITPAIVKFFKEHGVDVITTGNHVWQRQEIGAYLAAHRDVLRPANFPAETPGSGVTTFTCKGFEVGVINVQGRVFMKELLACPFRTVESNLTYLRDKTNIIFVDMHAETTAEKMGLAYFLDGKISGIVGTHTHVQTADERILPGGTAYITDLGMAGSLNSMIGMKKEAIIRNFLTQMPERFAVDTSSPLVMTGAWIEVDTITGKATDIQRVKVVDNDIRLEATSERS
ncbi:MAG TPA: TIGR00282 family metallophosphoesterase [Candidatus Limnocylindria bacterium]|nr:TIGR00282 family metallophosphoesterase [Candidatus Limnocylindria bacterium]